ncbi:SRPBCC family protein [Xinfangfangia sp. D13-10-4-6]|uniref:SRPBCC family protein n=1 Tax=Pseudogemmobacter hezensis TaxID=2737662 RepID=UPI001557FCFE|nr:SRPBCC family protein [Pseudogemmobacter hezensis]NPD14360.1 SRPBCC family protein [Pseudogemmobacter hezensis]
MNFRAKKDIEAPLDFVWQQLTDFPQYERMAVRRGAEVERVDHLRTPGAGMGWRIRFAYKNKPRKVLLRVVEMSVNQALDFDLDSPSVAGGIRVELLELSPRLTRISLAAEIRPKTLAARLLIQSLRLVKGRTQRRLDGQMNKLAQLIEQRLRNGAG